MDLSRKTRSPLIIDPDKEFLESLAASPHPSNIVPQMTSSGKEAQLLLSDPKTSFAGVFINPEISQPGGISVIRCAHMHKPSTPVFLIQNGETSLFTEKEMKKLGIHGSAKKPLTLEQITTLIAPSAFFFDSTKAVSSNQSDPEHQIDLMVSAEDSKFTAIRAADFLSGTTSFFDLYVRLNANKYIKILQSGDKFQAERVQSYLKKGVIDFFIKKEAQEHYVSYCDQIATTLLKSTKAPTRIQATQVMNHGQEVLGFLRTKGLNETNIQYAAQFLGNVKELVTKMEPGKQPLLKGFLSDLLAYDHGVGVATIAGLLLPALEITSNGPAETVGMAGLFHDIGLVKLGITTENTEQMTPEELAIYKTHPTVGSELLAQVRGFNPAAIQAVLQHHERRNRKGFPNGVGSGHISMISEVVGLSDEIFQLILKLKENPKVDLSQEIALKITDAFSPKLVAEFKKVFLALTS